ncbi:MAG: class II fructose-bisphosphate aldolase, partial [Candidatus Limivicinus sp.]
MLINLTEILKIAEEKQMAVSAFNTPNTESLNAVLNAAERLNVPVILMHAQVHDYAARLNQIGPVMVQAAKMAEVPVCVHLDHGEDLDYLEAALKIGFTGIMYDGSVLPYDENLENTKKAVSMAASYGAGVEAELGALAS